MKIIKLTLISILFFPILTSAYTAALNVDTNTNSINAIEGTILIPQNISIAKIYDGNSTILFWVDKPTLDKDINAIRFSGFTPGGFQGKKILFSFDGDFTIQDLNKFTFIDVRALGNDGLGTVVPVKLSVIPNKIENDSTPPEAFTPVVSKSPDAFDNSYFISFVAQDKGVGIDHFEYATTWFFKPDASAWRKIESPFALAKSEVLKRIFIKAIDKNGNESISTLYGPKYFETTLFGFIIIVLIICALSFISRRFL